MYWFQRPPYLRWMGAGAIAVAALVVEFWPTSVVSYPFAAVDIATGSAVVDVEWRPVPSGIFPDVPPIDDQTVASSNIAAGTPLTRAALRPQQPVPADWLVTPAPVPAGTAPGTSALAITDDGSVTVAAVVVAAAKADAFGIDSGGSIAVPPETAAAVGIAAANGRLIVLVQQSG